MEGLTTMRYGLPLTRVPLAAVHGVLCSGFLEADGLFGPLVVRRAREEEALASLYDLDLPEHTVTLWHWYPHLSGDYLPLRLFRNESVSGAGILVNGKGRVAAVTFGGPGRENGTNQEYDTPLEEFSVVQVSTIPATVWTVRSRIG